MNPAPATGARRDPYQVMRGRVTELYAHWELWRELFDGAPDKAQTMDRVAPAFFLAAQNVLLRDVLLGLCRLSAPDGAEDGRRKRRPLALRRVIRNVRPSSAIGPEVRARLEGAMGVLDGARDRLKELRDRTLAHGRADATVRDSTLAAADVQMVTDSVRACAAVMEALDDAQGSEQQHSYRDCQSATGQAALLLTTLRKYLRYR